MKTRKNFKKLLAITLATTSIFSTSLTLPASADYSHFLTLSDDAYTQYLSKQDLSTLSNLFVFV